MEQEKNKLIQFRHIVKEFDGQVVLKGIDLDIYENEFVTLLGPSGCGKTTLLRILGGFLEPSEGQVILNGEDICEVPAYKRELNTVFQKYALFPHMNVYDNIVLPFVFDKSKWDEDYLKELIKELDIEKLLYRKAGLLSGGEKQRVAICRALINDPDLVLADEPTGNLDSKSGKIVIDALTQINREFKKTIVMVTHDPQMASYCSRIILLKDGLILDTLKRGESQEAFYQEIIGRMAEL